MDKRLDIDAIRQRVDKATRGPWYHTRWHVATEPNITGGYPPNPASICETADGEYIENYNEADAEFIANARQDVPALLAEVEQLNKSRDWYDAEMYRCINRNTTYSEEINRLKGKLALYEALAQENDYYAILNEMSEDDD